MYRLFGKRIFDVSISMTMLLLMLPFLVLISIILALALKGSPLFIQLRPGREGSLFKFVKFRTMTNSIDKNGMLLPDAERMTKIGRFLRHTSLDELLSFWNVFKGDMSLVGPRPLLAEYLPIYSAEQIRRHEVKPGITGWAQINGRNTISWEEKFKLDIWYLDNMSLICDLKILLVTIKKVFMREGISPNSRITMERFDD